MIKKLIVSCVFLSGVFCVHSQSYSRLDEKIVDAYNSEPKKTQDVYIYSMQILEKARMDSSDDASLWEDKAQKLITVACYSEADRAMDNNDAAEAYLWAMRGISNGTSGGELAGVNMKQVYDYMKKLSESLARVPEIKEMKYGETKLEILDPNKVKKSNQYLSREKVGDDGRLQEKNKPYELVEGPAQDASGNLYVKVKYDFGAVVVIRHYKEGGWEIMEFPGEPGTFLSWQECADANAKNQNLKDLPNNIVRKKSQEKKYYVPEDNVEK